jgi:RecA-family ATPase
MKPNNENKEWIVRSLLPVGCTLLVGKSKAKKSWFAINTALAVAMNSKALGCLDVNQGHVLYLDLEGNPRRMKGRIQDTLGKNCPWPNNVTIVWEWSTGSDCLVHLGNWMYKQPDTKLVVVDMLENIHMPPKEKAIFIQYLSQFAIQHNISILALYRIDKTRAIRVFRDIEEAAGLFRASDATLVIEHEEPRAMLHIKGRDIENKQYPILWNEARRTWLIVE